MGNEQKYQTETVACTKRHWNDWQKKKQEGTGKQLSGCTTKLE